MYCLKYFVNGEMVPKVIRANSTGGVFFFIVEKSENPIIPSFCFYLKSFLFIYT